VISSNNFSVNRRDSTCTTLSKQFITTGISYELIASTYSNAIPSSMDAVSAFPLTIFTLDVDFNLAMSASIAYINSGLRSF
jgi:hypothetical protein